MLKLDEVKKNIISSFRDEDELEDIEEEICYLCNETFCIGNMNYFCNEFDEDGKEIYLCQNCYYSGKCDECDMVIHNINDLIYLIDNYKSIDTCTICLLEQQKMKNINNKKVNSYIKPSLLYKFNNLKNKIQNNTLNKDISIKIKDKTYNFKSNKNIELKCKTEINNYINNINNFRKKYYSKYNKMTDDDIKNLKKQLEEKERNNKLFWDNYNKSVLESKNKLNNIFNNDPVIEIDKELFNNKYEDRSLSDIYKNIISEIDNLEREYNNFIIIETYYNKLKENTNINSVFKNSNNKINKLFTDYENNRINEYKVLLEIGDLVVNDKISIQEKKEINSINKNSRPARLLKQANRIYILEEFINLKNIALSGISNWLRDTSDDNFNILLSFFNKKDTIPDLEYFSDDDKPIENKRTTKIIFT